MENTGSHAKDELNTKTEDGRVLGISITSGLLRNYYVIYSSYRKNKRQHRIPGINFSQNKNALILQCGSFSEFTLK